MADVRWGEPLRRGDILVCENGHPICEADRDMNLGDLPGRWHEPLVNWRQDQPSVGGPLPACVVCGGDIFGNLRELRRG